MTTRADALRALVAKWRQFDADCREYGNYREAKTARDCADELDAALGCETDEGVVDSPALYPKQRESYERVLATQHSADADRLASALLGGMTGLSVLQYALGVDAEWNAAITAAEQRGAARERAAIHDAVHDALHDAIANMDECNRITGIVLTAITERPE